MLTSDFQPYFSKQPLKIKKSQKNCKLWLKTQSVSIFLDMTKVADLRWKNADASRTQKVSHKINIFFGSSLGKLGYIFVDMCERF